MITKDPNPSLTPYDSLVKAIDIVGDNFHSRKGAVDYSYFTDKYPGKFMKIHMMQIGWEQVIAGIFAPEWKTRDMTSYMFLSSYQWELGLRGEKRDVYPKLTPKPGNENNFPKLFGKDRTLVELMENGHVKPTLSGVHSFDITEAMQNLPSLEKYILNVDGKTNYNPGFPLILASVVTSAITKLAARWQAKRQNI